MAFNGRPPSPRQQADEKFAASQRHDERFLKERKEKEAQNLAKTMELRRLRIAGAAQKALADAAAAENAPKPVKKSSRKAVAQAD